MRTLLLGLWVIGCVAVALASVLVVASTKAIPIAVHARVPADPPAPAIDWSPWRAELDVCRERTDSLRGTLEVLIRVWPGRAALPEAPSGWPSWPKPGVARQWRKDGW